MKELADGFVEELDDKRVRVWTVAGDGGYWTTMSKLRHEGTMEENKTPLFCPICKIPMLVDVDKTEYYKNGCCFKCSIYFVEGRKERWKSGWRPNEEEMIVYYEWRDRKKVFSIDEETLKKINKSA